MFRTESGAVNGKEATGRGGKRRESRVEWNTVGSNALALALRNLPICHQRVYRSKSGTAANLSSREGISAVSPLIHYNRPQNDQNRHMWLSAKNVKQVFDDA